MGTTEGLTGGLLRKALAAGMVAATLTMGLTGIVASSASASSSAKTTVIFAEQAQAPPNYIFPFMSLAFFSVSNLNQFQHLMYRPLYWFGNDEHARPEPIAVAGQEARLLEDNNTVVTQPEELQVVQR